MPCALPRLHPPSRLQSYSSKGSFPGPGASWSPQKAWDQQAGPHIFCAHPSNTPGSCRGPAHCPLRDGDMAREKAAACSGHSGSGIYRCHFEHWWLQALPTFILTHPFQEPESGEKWGRKKQKEYGNKSKSIYEAWPLTLAQAVPAPEDLQTLFLL